MSNKEAYLVFKLWNMYTLEIVQIYAPAPTYYDDKVKATYECIAKTLNNTLHYMNEEISVVKWE